MWNSVYSIAHDNEREVSVPPELFQTLVRQARANGWHPALARDLLIMDLGESVEVVAGDAAELALSLTNLLNVARGDLPEVARAVTDLCRLGGLQVTRESLY
jgi:hypothetical protein